MTTRFYGDGGTIHGTTHLDVETRDGKVVAVWFRCAALPFVQTEVDAERAEEMARMCGAESSDFLSALDALESASTASLEHMSRDCRLAMNILDSHLSQISNLASELVASAESAAS